MGSNITQKNTARKIEPVNCFASNERRINQLYRSSSGSSYDYGDWEVLVEGGECKESIRFRLSDVAWD